MEQNHLQVVGIIPQIAVNHVGRQTLVFHHRHSGYGIVGCNQMACNMGLVEHLYMVHHYHPRVEEAEAG